MPTAHPVAAAAAADDASTWLATAASVRGKSHVDGGLPNQDSVAVERILEADAWIAVVSDGAGTAARAEEGSREAALAIAAGLRAYAQSRRDRATDLSAFRDAIEESVDGLRARLLTTGWPLSDFHCTFVACLLIGPSGCIACIGDSVALTTRFALLPGSAGAAREVDFFPDASSVLHEPERGEYANETHFVTESDWRDHLRVAMLPTQTDAVVLMTDGAMDVAMSRKKVFRGFLSNLVGRLAVTPARDERDATVDAWLSDRQTFGITGDDKTLVVLLRNDARALAKLPLFLGENQPASKTPQEARRAAPGDQAPVSDPTTRTPATDVPARVEQAAPAGSSAMPRSSVLALGAAAMVLVAAFGAAYAIWVRQGSREVPAGRVELNAVSASSSATTAASDSAGQATAVASSSSSASASASQPPAPVVGKANDEAASAPAEPTAQKPAGAAVAASALAAAASTPKPSAAARAGPTHKPPAPAHPPTAARKDAHR